MENQVTKVCGTALIMIALVFRDLYRSDEVAGLIILLGIAVLLHALWKERHLNPSGHSSDQKEQS